MRLNEGFELGLAIQLKQFHPLLVISVNSDMEGNINFQTEPSNRSDEVPVYYRLKEHKR